jgi:ribosomal protein S27AE
MPTCQLCQASGFRLPTKNCKKCARLMCQAHWYAVPMIQENIFLEAMQGRSSMLSRGPTTQSVMVWMTNPAAVPEKWNDARFFCGPQCAAGFIGTLTPHDVPGANGQPIRVLTYSEFGTSANLGSGGDVDYGKMATAGGIFVIVGSNLHPQLQPVFQARATQSDLQAQEVARARRAWESGDYNLAAEIYDKLGQPQYAAQARELARTQNVVTTNVSVNYNQLVEQLKELRKPVAYSCPKCGAGAVMDGNLQAQHLKCAYCGANFEIPDILAAVNRMVVTVPAQTPTTAKPGNS